MVIADIHVELTESFKERDEGKKNNPYVTRSGWEAIKKKPTQNGKNTSIAKQQQTMEYIKRLETWLYQN